MKYFFAILLTAAAGFAANVDFATGQAARLFIGQTQATRQQPGASDTLLGGVSGVAFANDMLFVADSNRVNSGPINNRVLVYRNVSGNLPKPTAELSYTQRCPICVGTADTVLGQPDFQKTDAAKGASGMRLPTGVASDGTVLAVADTDNNRILIWKSIPTGNGQAADVVLGQKDFNSGGTSVPPSASSLRGPQGVWIQNGMLFVADTQDHRILVWKRIPSSNGAPADLVLGQPDFTTYVEPDLTQQKSDATASNMLNPVSVTSDGVKLFVTDLGHNRVLIWNSIPSANGAAADVVIGQPDMKSAIANNSYTIDKDGVESKVLCESTGTDSTTNNPTYPARCNATMEFPRFTLSDGQRLFVADGGNDRVLVFNSIPTQNGQAADYVIGQLGGGINQASDAADSMRTPMAMAWDGTNLYVSDTYNRRINVYSMGEHSVPYSGVRNAASFEIYAVGSVAFTGTIVEGETTTINIAGKDYTYKNAKDDTFGKLLDGLVAAINADSGDPNVYASPNYDTATLQLTARAGGENGNAVEYSATTAAVKSSDAASITATTSGSTLSGGMDAAKIGPGTIVSIVGDNLADSLESAPAGTTKDTLADTQVYFDGVRAPLLYVSPTQINAQIPWEFLDTTSINAYVRTVRKSGIISVTTPVAVSIVPENPGIFTMGGNDPRPGVALHYSSNAMGTVSVDGSAKAGDTATVTIEDRSYTYTVVDGDTLDTVRDALIALINNAPDPKVKAFAAGTHDRIRLMARVAGPDGNGIPFGASAPDGAQVIMTATNSALCCANVAGAPITNDNPALPGETIVVLATGLGLPTVLDSVVTGQAWPDSAGVVQPREFVSSLAGGKTANVLYAGLKPGLVGVWEVHLELNTDLPTNPQTQAHIAQAEYTSNIITFPVVNPNQ
jgi:sugar lactone lactonase YvrE